ncbi:MAG: DUF937 domain-containing protein [Saprospiraceae bacterium]
MNILEMLQNQLNPEVIDQLAKQIGVNDPAQVQAASNGLISTLVAALNKNTGSSMGLNSFVSALDRDHDGSIMNDIMGFIRGNSQPANASATNGSGILGHILGGLQPNVVDMISRISGIDKAKVGQLALTIAPLLLGFLGKQRQDAGLNVGGIGSLLKQSAQSVANQPQTSLINKFLDRNGDGSVIDDLARMGMDAFLKR